MSIKAPTPAEAKLQHNDLKFDDMNRRMDGFDVRFTGIEGSIALMNVKSETVANSLHEVRNDIRLLVNSIAANRESDDNKPSMIRTSTLFQVLALVLASSTLVSGFMFIQISPLEKGIEASTKASESKHDEQQTWIKSHAARLDKIEADSLTHAKCEGQTARDLELLWQRVGELNKNHN